jgi:nucleotide-binding universal stress UspA family protein
MHAELILVRAVEPPNPWVVGAAYGYAEPIPAVAAAETYLTELAADVRHSGLPVSTAVAQGEAAQVIGDVVRNQNAHLVAMASRGRGGVTRALLGSVAEEVLRATRVPILFVRPAAVIPREIESGTARERPIKQRPGEAPLVAVLMSQQEVELARLALEALADSPLGKPVAQSARALRHRLGQTPSRIQGEPVSTRRN